MGQQLTSKAHAAVVRKHKVTYTRVTTGSCSQGGTGVVRTLLSILMFIIETRNRKQAVSMRTTQRHPAS